MFLWSNILSFIEEKNIKNWATFICSKCEKLNENILAFANIESVDIEDRGQDIYTLQKLPISENHGCAQCGSELLVIACMRSIIQPIVNDPRRPNRLYSDVRIDITKDLELDKKLAFLQVFPSFDIVKSNLYKKRKNLFHCVLKRR